MALVSPGISISINDQSQYVNSNVGSVPLVVLATAQDKTYNGSAAAGTSAANAGQLLSFTSQRDLVTQMGTPSFQLSSAGTPVNGSEVNEYGLMAAYSALGLTNQLFAIRADVDLNELVGTSVRPIAAPAAGTYWLDTVNTNWGIYSLNAATSAFSELSPLIITSSGQVSNDTTYTPTTVPTPIASIGQIGQYALVMVNTSGTAASAIRLFYKAGYSSVSVSGSGSGITVTPNGLSNTWVQVGSPNWQQSTPIATGTAISPTIASTSTLTINTVGITTSSTTTAAAFVTSINAAKIPGVYAALSSTGQVQLFATSSAASNGSTADGKVVITDGTNSPLYTAGLVTATSSGTATFYCPYFFYGSYAQAPSGGWYSTDSQPRPTGSIWWKTSATGGGWAPVLQQYNAATSSFATLTVPMYSSTPTAIYGLDPIGGGTNITAGQTVAKFGVDDNTYNSLKFIVQEPNTITTATGGVASSTISGTFTIQSTAPGGSAYNGPYSIVLSSATPTFAVQQILGQNIPFVTASLNSNGTITLTHTTGGEIKLANTSGTPLTGLGFVSGSGTGFTVNAISGNVYINNFEDETSTIEYQASAPYSAPATGTYWYYSNPADIDVMVNEVVGGVQLWRGYRNVTQDVRGYNLHATDPNGVIVTPTTAPTSQSTGAALVAGDLWLDSGDLVNYPSLYRYNGTTWTAIDTADHVSNGGIVFADARWDSTGTTDVISGALPSVATLLTSDYIDLDAPDYRLYPRGTLLFNTRRSGYNVKKFVPGYYNATSFPNVGTNSQGYPTTLPTITDAWVTASGLDSNGVVLGGSKAQRAIVVGAMQAALDSNLDVLSPTYQFNLICAPGYPELIPNMLTLNDNRGDTAFIIGDTPLDLAPNTVDITNWVNNTTGTGLPSDAAASPYLALYYPSGLTNDLSGNQIVVPATHAVLRTFLYNDQVSYPWFAPAGVNRGLVTNLSDIGYINSSTGEFVHNAISQGLRDALFTLQINPITQLPGSGLVVWGQLTREAATTSRNRINVVRLENYLRTIFSSISNGYIFEPNDAVTRKSIAAQIENALNNILAHRGLYDFLVICDTSNNTSATISNNQLYVDVAIEPMRDVEFIYIPIAIYNPGSIAQLNVQST